MKPDKKPINTCYSSGPCAKHPGYTIEELKDAPLGRSHRSAIGKARLKESIERTKKILGIPEDYLVGIMPGSDTGAFEMLMWNVLGPRGVDVVAFESFGFGWAYDIEKELKIPNINKHFADYGQLPDLSKVDFSNDVVFAWNGTTSGVKVPNGDWIPDDREGLTLCDATSAVFAMDIPWNKIDGLTFSWQKVLGGEAAHGMLVLSPRAVQRIESYNPPWPIPKVFRLKKKGALNLAIFQGSPINTPSMLCNEDYLRALDWAESIGGLRGLIARSEENLKVLEDFVGNHPWISFLAEDKSCRSNTSVCLKVDLTADQIKAMVRLLADEDVAYDINSYSEAPVGLRIWCGATVEKTDLEILCQWLKWAYDQVKGR